MTVETLRACLRAELVRSMKARDRVAMAACRAALALIDNEEAADVSEAPPIESGHIAGGVAGLGSGEVARRELASAEAVALLEAEVARWRELAVHHDAASQPERAERLRAEADVIATILESHQGAADH